MLYGCRQLRIMLDDTTFNEESIKRDEMDRSLFNLQLQFFE